MASSDERLVVGTVRIWFIYMSITTLCVIQYLNVINFIIIKFDD